MLKAEEQGDDSLLSTTKLVPEIEVDVERPTKRHLQGANTPPIKVKKSKLTPSDEISVETTEKNYDASDTQCSDFDNRHTTKYPHAHETSSNPVSGYMNDLKDDGIDINGTPSTSMKNKVEYERKEALNHTRPKRTEGDPDFLTLKSANITSGGNSVLASTQTAATANANSSAIGETNLKTDKFKDASDSCTSTLFDESDKTKKKSKKSGMKRQTNKTKHPSQHENNSSPDEIRIKVLQSQLRKCGVRTIWHFEPKYLEEDNKAKIRHLQKALRDVGMKGRFSEAKAKEIKEARELMADLEAVKEGEKIWGLNNGNQNEDYVKNNMNRNYSDESLGDKFCDSKKMKGPNLRYKTLRRKSSATKIPRPSAVFDWLGNEEESE